MGSMKVHQLSRGLSSWDHEPQPSLSLGCKRLRLLAPRLAATSSSSTASPFDLKSFIRPHDSPRKPEIPNDHKREPPQVDTQPGGTRWNPTQEQIGILEMLYRGGMRTPNAQQIEDITAQLGKYGKIEGKNVFYWFQNHKARERQKLKRHNLGLTGQQSPRITPATNMLSLEMRGELMEKEDDSPCKRKCKSWGFEKIDVVEREICKLSDNVTLELFPLRPEGR